MGKKIVSGIMLTLLLIGMLTLAFDIQPVEASGTIYIRAGGSVDPPTAPISSVDNITYTFTDNIYDEIVVERDNIMVDGVGYNLDGSEACPSIGIYLSGRSNITIKNIEIKRFWHGIYLNDSSNSIISGNNITAITHYGIWLASSSNNDISGNNAANNGDGIYLDGSSNNTVSGNHITENQHGIGLEFSLDNSISGNNITENDSCGIYLLFSSNNTLRGNSMANNTYNFWVLGVPLSDFLNNVDTSNTVDGKPAYYWVNKRDAVVPLDAGYVALVNSTRITVRGLNLKNAESLLVAFTTNSTITQNVIANNDYGIWLRESSNNSIVGNNVANNSFGIMLDRSSNYNSIVGNNITNNWCGIWLESSNYNCIAGNNITANNGYGIHLEHSSNNSISGNNITANHWHGIYLTNSSSNTIYHNNLVDNNWQVYDDHWERPATPPSINIWDDGYPSGGNYWSDYTDVDLYSGPYQNETGSDDIWDHPYVIDTDNQDRYPLANPTWMPPPPAPDFSLTTSPTSLTIQQGSSDTSVITITSISGFDQPVQLTVSGAPSGVTATLNPEQVTPPPDGSTTSTLTVSVDTTATPGSYTLTVTGTNGTLTHSVDISLEITAPQADLSVSIDWVSNYSPAEGEPVTINVTVTNIGNAESGLSFVRLCQHVLYMQPISYEQDIILVEYRNERMTPGESRHFTFVWNAVEILNVEQKSLYIHVYATDANQTNNYNLCESKRPRHFTL